MFVVRNSENSIPIKNSENMTEGISNFSFHISFLIQLILVIIQTRHTACKMYA